MLCTFTLLTFASRRVGYFLLCLNRFFFPVTSTSALILFCSRLLMIVNMYRPHRSNIRYFCESLVYMLVAVFGMWSVPTTIYSIPEQEPAKIAIVSVSSKSRASNNELSSEPTRSTTLTVCSIPTSSSSVTPMPQVKSYSRF